MAWISPSCSKNDDERQSPARLPINAACQKRSVLIVALAGIIVLTGAAGVSQSQTFSDSDVRPFSGDISTYRQYAVDAQVTVGDWIYKLSRSAPILATKHLRHSEFGPFGDSNTMVLAIEIIVRNIGKSPARLPSLKVITKELVGTNDGPQPQWLEYDQYSAGYIERQLTSAVVFNPGEQLMGVIAFECCMNKGTQMAFLRVSDGVLTGNSALIPLSSPSPPPSVEPKPKLDCHDPGFTCGPPSQIPAAAVALNNRAVARADKGDLDGAILDYNEAIRLKPDYAFAFLGRGTARRVKGDLDGAIQDDTEAIRLKPDDAVFIGERGIARKLKGDLDGAIHDFSESIQLKPDDAREFDYRSEARLAKGDIDGAIQDCTVAVRLKPDFAECFNDRGVARQDKGDLDGAIQDYSEAIRLKPDYAIAFDSRGSARYFKGDLDGAIRDFSEAIRLKPDFARAFHDRGATRARNGDAAGARQDNNRAIQLGWH
jgi:tetratricopeptide (TPR) repeat protein